MLELLHIENIAVIELADIAFRPGFNALTGETGAGKSIVIDAMEAVLGGRTSRELIRTGADKAFVSAIFSDVPENLPGLTENGAAPDEDGNLTLQREISSEGKSICRVNGRPLTVTQLRQIGKELLNIHGQHDGQLLLDESRHLAYLDRFGQTAGSLAAYKKDYDVLCDIRKQLRALEMDDAEKERRMDSLRYQIDELERAELVPGEEEELNARRELLRNGEKYSSALSGADYCLNGDDAEDGAVSAIRKAEDSLSGIRHLNGDMEELFKRVETLRCEVFDLAEIIRDKREEFDFSPAELDAAEARTDQLYRLKKKYGDTVEDMIAYQERCRDELNAMETADDLRLQLEQKLKRAGEAVEGIYFRQLRLALNQRQHIVDKGLLHAVVRWIDPFKGNLLFRVGNVSKWQQLGLADVFSVLAAPLEAHHFIGHAVHSVFNSGLSAHDGLLNVRFGGKVSTAALEEAQLNTADLGTGLFLDNGGQMHGQTA